MGGGFWSARRPWRFLLSSLLLSLNCEVAAPPRRRYEQQLGNLGIVRVKRAEKTRSFRSFSSSWRHRSLNRDLVESVGVLGVLSVYFYVVRAGPGGETRTADRVDTSRAPDHRANRFQLLRGEKRRRQTLPGRLELPTLRLTASRSSQLSYGSY